MSRLCYFVVEFVGHTWFIDSERKKWQKKGETDTSAECRDHPLGKLYTLLGTLTVLSLLNIKHCCTCQATESVTYRTTLSLLSSSTYTLKLADSGNGTLVLIEFMKVAILKLFL